MGGIDSKQNFVSFGEKNTVSGSLKVWI